MIKNKHIIVINFLFILFCTTCLKNIDNKKIEHENLTYYNETTISEISKLDKNNSLKKDIFEENIQNEYFEGELEEDLSPLESIWNKASSKEEDQEAIAKFKATAVIINNKENVPIIIYERPDSNSQKKGFLDIDESFQILQAGGLVAFIRSDQSKKGYWYKIVSQKYGLGSIFLKEEIISNNQLRIFKE
jgi:hypothetical protein